MSDQLAEAIMEILLDHANAEEANAVNMKHRIAELVGAKGAVAVKEETFNGLTYEKQTGAKIGEFEVASEKNNIPEKVQRAFNVLKRANATISDRYGGEGYVYSYWLYNSKIYRQKLKK